MEYYSGCLCVNKSTRWTEIELGQLKYSVRTILVDEICAALDDAIYVHAIAYYGSSDKRVRPAGSCS